MNEDLQNLVQLMRELGENQGDVMTEVHHITDAVARARRLKDTSCLSPPSFSGSSSVDADRWLDRFQQYCSLAQYNDDQKCTTLRLLLVQAAEVWNRSLDNANQFYNGPLQYRQPYCSNCNVNSHNIGDCRSIPLDTGQAITCYQCGKPGHLARSCHSKVVLNSALPNDGIASLLPSGTARPWSGMASNRHN